MDVQKQRVALYIRVSTDDQVERFGLHVQQAELDKYVSLNPVLESSSDLCFIDKGESGAKEERPALVRLREAVKEGKVDTVIVLKIDRLARDLHLLLGLFDEFRAHGVNFISVHENINFSGAIGTLMFQIFGAIAQFERELIKGRTHAGKKASARLGNWVNGPAPYGYQKKENANGKGSKLELDEEQKEVVKEIFYQYVYTEKGFGAIAKELTEKHIPHNGDSRSRSKRWTERMVKNIVNQEAYTGQYVLERTDEQGREIPEDEWEYIASPSIISRTLYDLAQKKVSEKTTGQKKDTHVYLLRGLITDLTTTDHKKMKGKPRSGQGHSYHRERYISRDGTKYAGFEIPAVPIEEFVWAKLLEALSKPEDLLKRALALKENKSSVEKLEGDIMKLENVLNKTQQKLDKAWDTFSEGNIDQDRYLKTRDELEGATELLNDQKARLEAELSAVALLNTKMDNVYGAGKFLENLEKLSRLDKRALIQYFVKEVTIDKVMNSDGEEERVFKVKLRFNPQHIIDAQKGVRTSKPTKNAACSGFVPKIVLSGGYGRT